MKEEVNLSESNAEMAAALWKTQNQRSWNITLVFLTQKSCVIINVCWLKFLGLGVILCIAMDNSNIGFPYGLHVINNNETKQNKLVYESSLSSKLKKKQSKMYGIGKL